MTRGEGLFDKEAEVFLVENLTSRENPVSTKVKDLCPDSFYRSSFVDSEKNVILRNIGCGLKREEIIRNAELYPESKEHPIYVQKMSGEYSQR
jgi:hypothetical protein